MRKMIAICLAALLSACATTTPATVGLSDTQKTALTEAGFVPMDGNFELGLADKILFDFNSTKLKPKSSEYVRKIAKVLTDIGINGATVEGHTDAVGNAAYNEKLSAIRADEVKRVLLEEGMDPARLVAKALGETDPIHDNETDGGRAENRRVVIVVSSADSL